MHSKRIVHRDLKLENVMVEDAGGRVVLIDFGLSNFWTPGSALRTHCGSAEYAAPEVFDQAFPLCPKVVTFRRIDGATFCLLCPKIDVWSFGVILYAILVGRLPFVAEDNGTKLSSLPRIVRSGLGARSESR